MYKACKTGQFPSIEIMCKYGLTGFKGTNPIAIFERYKSAVKYGMTENELELIDGVEVAPNTSYECLSCGFCSLVKVCTCSEISTCQGYNTVT
jgi:hypothetical protein